MEGGSNDAAFCYDTALVAPSLTICLPSIPTGPHTINSSPPLDTDAPSPCVPKVTPGGDYYVIAAADITVNTTVRAKGHRSLILIASESILVDEGGVIDVGSHLMPDEWIGAGADPLDPGDCVRGTTPTSANQGGGGAGGSFNGSGGPGGDGAGDGSGSGGNPGMAAMPVTGIRGGCAGQDGAGDSPGHGGHGGHGGGAVFLLAGKDISVRGAILAGGEGGGGGVTAGGMTHPGGGGGGAGGMIGLEAHSINVTGRLLANGGGGGEGAGFPSRDPDGNGAPGHDATTVPPTCGGSGGTIDAGGGGCGSPGCKQVEICEPFAPSDTLTTEGGSGKSGSSSGGGGGGGGAGLIKVHGSASASLEGQVSPPPTP